MEKKLGEPSRVRSNPTRIQPDRCGSGLVRDKTWVRLGEGQLASGSNLTCQVAARLGLKFS